MSYKDASNKKCLENIIFLEWINNDNDIFIKLKQLKNDSKTPQN